MKFNKTKRCNIVIDLSNQVWRSYHATKNKNMLNDDGVNVGFIIGFVKILYHAIKISKDFNALPKLLIVEDRTPTRKRNLFAENKSLLRKETDLYKGTRHKEKLEYNILDIINQFLNCIPHHTVWCEGEEADDVIASFIEEHPGDVNVIFSTDKDLWQLFNYHNVTIMNGTELLTEEYIKKRFDGASYTHVVLHKCIRGDSGDNVKGIFQYRFKDSIVAYLECNGTFKDYVKKLKEHNMIKQLQDIKQHIDLIKMNYKLTKLRTDLTYNIKTISKDDKVMEKWVKLCYVFQVPSLLHTNILNSF